MNRNGEYPIYIRVTKDRVSWFITTGICVEESQWDEKQKKVKKGYPNSLRVNHHTSQLWSLAKLQYQVDRTQQPIQFVRTGFRAKVFFEYQYQIKEVQNGFVHVGMDVRHYVPLYKNIVLANKLSGAISGGETRGMMYVLGGTTNWLAPRTDTSVHFIPGDNYSFISYANSLRGYTQNIRTGNTYLLLNSEIRLPILNTFYNKYTSLNSLNNMQFVPFIDIGNAWTPSLNQKLPTWAIGYGFGLRTTLLSYFVRVDLAWQNINQSNQKRPMVVIGMGREY
ncbi:MAG: BamA/TamA family outer membrane protein [Bacteroidetes bacterium]|nr:BamA/TamA family outer membrane protein [Bacteroidota bacterium]